MDAWRASLLVSQAFFLDDDDEDDLVVNLVLGLASNNEEEVGLLRQLGMSIQMFK